MDHLVSIIQKNTLTTRSQKELDGFKKTGQANLVEGNCQIYPNSLYAKENILYFMARVGTRKSLFLVSIHPFSSEFVGTKKNTDGLQILQVERTPENASVLKRVFPFTAPISLRDKQTTIGCGDRLGLATPGHIRAARKYNVYPVLAQQSIRELTFTNRTFANVTADTAFLVFQEGFERGYGADGDHLKTIADIDVALQAGMPMITLDLSETMNYAAEKWSNEHIATEFASLPAYDRQRLLDTFSGKSFSLDRETISFTEQDMQRCTVMYKKAIDFAQEVDRHLKNKRGTAYDLEISIDETQAPTLPQHHFFIIQELNRRGILVNSLAPRFIGEFQKAIDYIGDKAEFERQFKTHCAIARQNGHYKVSVHSGSDKFSVYPAIGSHTGLKLHLKTAGTSWLEAVRCISTCEPQLYRKIHSKALDYFDTARKAYHVTTDLKKIVPLESRTDRDLPRYLEEDDSRQLIHITYGGILNDPSIRSDLFESLNRHEEAFYSTVERHIEKHLKLLGVPQIQGENV